MDLAVRWINATEAQLKGKAPNSEEEDAVIKMSELSSDKPRDAMQAILQIVALKPKTMVLNCLGAGPLEELVIKYPEYLSEFIALAHSVTELKDCLAHVSLRDEDSPNVALLRNFVGTDGENE